MTQRVIVTVPGEIDADPAEVGPIVAAQLQEATAAVAELARESLIQLRSSWMSRFLDGRPELSADSLRVQWEQSDEAATATRLVGSLEAAERIAQRL